MCFIRSDEGRAGFLARRVALHPGRLIDHASGTDLGPVDAVELVTVGQRRGMGHGSDGRRRFVTSVDVATRRVTLGPPEAACIDSLVLQAVSWVGSDPTGAPFDETTVDALAQSSAHGEPVPCSLSRLADGLAVRFSSRQRRVARGQTVALYDPADPDSVLGSGVAT